MHTDIIVSANIFVSFKTIMSDKLVKINWKNTLLADCIER